MRVSLGINYWDDIEGLIDILTNETLYDFVDRIYLINGRYKGRTDKPRYNPEALPDLVSLFHKVVLINMEDCIQIEKRNKYFELAEKDEQDFLIVVDSDENVIIDDMEQFKSTLRLLEQRPERCFPIMIDHEQVTSMRVPRMFKYHFDYRYKQHTGHNISHGSIWSDYGKGNRDMVQDMHEWYNDHELRTGILGVHMTHNKKYRPKERVIADRIYYDENPTR
jgi:hypothetical protein